MTKARSGTLAVRREIISKIKDKVAAEKLISVFEGILLRSFFRMSNKSVIKKMLRTELQPSICKLDQLQNKFIRTCNYCASLHDNLSK